MTRPDSDGRPRASWATVLLVLAFSAAILGAVVLLAGWRGVEYGTLTRDPAALAEAPFYTGFLSNLGIFFWAGAAAVCFFSAAVARGGRGPAGLRAFLAVSGVVSLVLGLDDVFMLHEAFVPIHLGIAEEVVLVAHAVLLPVYLAVFLRTIRETEYVVFVLALAFFAASIAVELVDPSGIDPYLLEDGAKFTGLVAWLAYFCRTGALAVRAGDVGPPAQPPSAEHRGR